MPTDKKQTYSFIEDHFYQPLETLYSVYFVQLASKLIKNATTEGQAHVDVIFAVESGKNMTAKIKTIKLR